MIAHLGSAAAVVNPTDRRLLRDWNATGELRPGITLLEASAGTGKTYSITSLVLRLVAEHDVAMRQLVVVTFTRAATAELRDRIRIRLSQAVAALEGPAPPPDDEVLAHLWEASEPQRATRLRRLRDAQHSFDEALIATIHGFCQRMLQQNAFESQADFDLALVEDSTDLASELVDDWLSQQRYAQDPLRYRFLVERCGVSRAELLRLASLALREPDLRVLPEPEQVGQAGWERELGAFAEAWDAGWGEAIAQVFEQAHQAGVFQNPRQRTYRLKKCEQEAKKLGDWLRGRPSLLDELPGAAYWASSAIRDKLAPEQPEPTHEGLSALRRLLAYPDRMAAGERARFVQWLRAEFDRRNRARRVQSYQDLLRGLARVLRLPPPDPARQALVSAIGGRFKAALIDEFQDTDDLQWTIFRALFGDRQHRLYLIGDPKQAIYGFRGANVHVYLEAQQAAGEAKFTMRTNYRSDARLVHAFNHLMDNPGTFGEVGIEYVPVGAYARAPAQRIEFPAGRADPSAAPMQIRFVDAGLSGAAEVSNQDDPVSKGTANALLPGRVAEDIVALLQSGAKLYDPGGSAADASGMRPVGPNDIGVLTRTGYQARAVHARLREAGVAAVLAGADSVLASDEARELAYWLEALEHAGRDRAARRAATTRIFGRDASLLARVDAEEPAALEQWDEWLGRLAVWRRRLAAEGFLPTLRGALDEDLVAVPTAIGSELRDATTRLLARPNGDRRLTNVWHLAELLHEAETREGLHLSGLLSWLGRQRARATINSETAELRLERDDAAVRVMTVHKSKGLQFPVVFVPFLYDGKPPGAHDPALVVPSAGRAAERCLDLREAGEREEAWQRARRESSKEAIRLLYVAVTRAQVRCVLYAGHIKGLEESPLAPILHGGSGQHPADRIEAGRARCSNAAPRALLEDLLAIAAGSDCASAERTPSIAVTRCKQPAGRVWEPPLSAAAPLAPREFWRAGLDPHWRRHSYSSLIHGQAAAPAAMGDEWEGFDPDPEEPSAVGGVSTGAAAPAAPTCRAADDAPSVPLASFPAGADAGTFLHAVFEQTDFRWAHPQSEDKLGVAAFRDLLLRLMPRHGFDPDQWLDPLSLGLLEVLRTPLGAALAQTRLCDVAQPARLDELRFDFPIAGGGAFGQATHRARVTPSALRSALCTRQQAVSSTDDEATIRASYLQQLQLPGKLAGFMTGSIDLVFRHPLGDHSQWFVVDYKSNRLDPERQRRYPIQNFCREGMRREMEQHHYYLQYHLYLLALHRFLRWRLGDGYAYERDMGGVYYLFFRGMIGQHTPTEGDRRYGAFYDRPPLCVIDALDRLFTDPARAHAGSGGPA